MFVFFVNVTALTAIYTLSLHDALPILPLRGSETNYFVADFALPDGMTKDQFKTLTPETFAALKPKITAITRPDRKSTRLNSSHMSISYAVFCLKKKINKNIKIRLKQLT